MSRLTKWTIATLMVLSSLAMAREPRSDEPGIGVARQIIAQVDGEVFDVPAAVYNSLASPVMFVSTSLPPENVMLLIDLLLEYDLKPERQAEWEARNGQLVRTFVYGGFVYGVAIDMDGIMLINWEEAR